MVRILFTTVAAFLIALTTFAVSNAQTGPTGPTNTPPTQPPAVTPNGISEADLVAVLKQLDPNVQTGKLADGGIEYRLTVKIDNWSYALRIESYANSIWIDAELGGKLADMQRIPSNLLGDLLFANLKVGPTHFALMKKDGGFMLNACRMTGRGITVAGFRAEIEQLCKDVRDTYPQWNAIVTIK